MSREIKFRAWYEGKMHSINEMHSAGEYWSVGMPAVPRLHDLELMQYTGLCDRNGVEIYEGDIVAVYEHGATEYNLNHANIGVVEWSNEHGRYEHIYPSISAWSRHEVIGNVWQSPDLLKEQS